MERVPRDGQRIVDTDGLARDLLAIPVHGQVGREVGGRAREEPGCVEVEVLHKEQTGRADGLDGQRSAFRDHQTLLVTEQEGRRRRDQEQDQPGVGRQRRELRPAVAVAVQVADAVTLRLADAEAVLAQDAGEAGPGTPAIAARSGSSDRRTGPAG